MFLHPIPILPDSIEQDVGARPEPRRSIGCAKAAAKKRGLGHVFLFPSYAFLFNVWMSGAERAFKGPRGGVQKFRDTGPTCSRPARAAAAATTTTTARRAHRVLAIFLNCGGLCWNAFLSWQNAKQNAREKRGKSGRRRRGAGERRGLTERDESLKGREIQRSRKSSFPALRRRCSSTQKRLSKKRERSAGGPVHIPRSRCRPSADRSRPRSRAGFRPRARARDDACLSAALASSSRFSSRVRRRGGAARRRISSRACESLAISDGELATWRRAWARATYATRFAKMMQIPHISAGDLVRDEIQRGTPLGSEIRRSRARGQLRRRDAMILDILKERVEKGREKGEKGFLLDGFPRTVHQAKEPRRSPTSRACSTSVCTVGGDPHRARAREAEAGAGAGAGAVADINYAAPPHRDAAREPAAGVRGQDGAAQGRHGGDRAARPAPKDPHPHRRARRPRGRPHQL